MQFDEFEAAFLSAFMAGDVAWTQNKMAIRAKTLADFEGK